MPETKPTTPRERREWMAAAARFPFHDRPAFTTNTVMRLIADLEAWKLSATTWKRAYNKLVAAVAGKPIGRSRRARD